MNKCKFDRAWIGACGKPTATTFCDEHSKEKCCSCGGQATRECDETGQFVCGFPLCNDCEHSIAPDGTNGGVGFYSTLSPEQKTHVKRVNQIFKPWYTRSPE